MPIGHLTLMAGALLQDLAHTLKLIYFHGGLKGSNKLLIQVLKLSIRD